MVYARSVPTLLPFVVPFLLLLIHAPATTLALSALCSSEYGYPTLPDCRAAIDRLPFTSTTVTFGPPGSGAGTVTCPFSIPLRTCTIRIQCSHRAEVTWGLMHTLTTILIEGDGVSRPGCVKDLGKGGVAALVSATDPIWIEIAQTGVNGPGNAGGGSSAPLLKGVTADQLAAAGLSVPGVPKPGPVLRLGPKGDGSVQ